MTDTKSCPDHHGTKPEICPWCAGSDWCYGHNQYEPMVEGGIACGECWHVFKTPQELIDEHNKVLAELKSNDRATTVEEVYVCPVCAHDL